MAEQIFRCRYTLTAPGGLTMPEPAIDVTFEAIELRDGSREVCALHASEMLPQYIADFKTEALALRGSVSNRRNGS